MKKKITIIGAGISGLATAHWLFKDGIECTVLDMNSDVGGTMETVTREHFLFDRGPNSGLETTPLIRTLVDDVGLTDDMIYANEKGNKRYILRNNTLHALPMGPVSFLKTRLFSAKAKFRLLAEPFIGKSEDGYYQSISQFVKRRLGAEFLDYAINPFVAGVYAGNPEKLSVKSAFPKLFRLEEVYGGLIKGMIQGAKERKKRGETSKQSAKMFSFKHGMQTLPKAIVRTLGERVLLNAGVDTVEKTADKYTITYNHRQEQKRLDTDIVVSTIPAFAASEIFRTMDTELSRHLSSLYYPPVLVLYAGYRKEAVGRKLDGFGFLIPEKERRLFLGTIWSSTIFPGRVDDDYVSFTLYVGGARSPEVFTFDEDRLQQNVLEEFQEIMTINEPPVFIEKKVWEKAIPQYEIGYIEHERYFQDFENNHPGIFLGGNFRGGISVGDCIKSSHALAQNVKQLVDNS